MQTVAMDDFRLFQLDAGLLFWRKFMHAFPHNLGGFESNLLVSW